MTRGFPQVKQSSPSAASLSPPCHLRPLEAMGPSALDLQESSQHSTFLSSIMVLVKSDDEIITLGVCGNRVINRIDTCSDIFDGKFAGCYLILKCLNEFWCHCEFINSSLNAGHAVGFDFLDKLRMTHNKF